MRPSLLESPYDDSNYFGEYKYDDVDRKENMMHGKGVKFNNEKYYDEGIFIKPDTSINIGYFESNDPRVGSTLLTLRRRHRDDEVYSFTVAPDYGSERYR